MSSIRINFKKFFAVANVVPEFQANPEAQQQESRTTIYNWLLQSIFWGDGTSVPDFTGRVHQMAGSAAATAHAHHMCLVESHRKPKIRRKCGSKSLGRKVSCCKATNKLTECWCSLTHSAQECKTCVDKFRLQSLQIRLWNYLALFQTGLYVPILPTVHDLRASSLQLPR